MKFYVDAVKRMKPSRFEVELSVEDVVKALKSHYAEEEPYCGEGMKSTCTAPWWDPERKHWFQSFCFSGSINDANNWITLPLKENPSEDRFREIVREELEIIAKTEIPQR